MFRPYELITMAVATFILLASVWLMQTEQRFAELWNNVSQTQVATPGLLVVGENGVGSMNQALQGSLTSGGSVQDLIINDIEVGTGPLVEADSTVTAHYIGTLPNGQEFDNSRVRGEPYTFTIGAGEVIAGWEKGFLGMREGGSRIIVIPPALGYGDVGHGPVPGGATLVFAVEVLSVE